MSLAAVTLEAPEDDVWADGVVCRTREIQVGGRHVGEILFAPTACGNGTSRLEPGWNVFADCDDRGRLAPNLHITRLRGLSSERAAVRFALAQIQANRAAVDQHAAARGRCR